MTIRRFPPPGRSSRYRAHYAAAAAPSSLFDRSQARIEQHVAPEIAEAREATLKALEQAKHGWQRALDKLAERANLTKSDDGT